ncbi:MAG: twitching motility protein PilT [Blastocatellia bacterium]|nr:twitching motility protein PilT [Blastocatellia bacterium]
MSEIQEPPNQETASPGALNLSKVLKQMLDVSDKVSDLIFSPGRPPQIDLVSKLQGVPIAGLEKLTPAQTYAIAKLIIGTHETSIESLEKYGSTDLSFGVPGLSRFRVNIFKQRGTYAIVMRVIPPRTPRFEDFNLPNQLRDIVELKNGIVLVTGPTGSGKSSSLAAVIDLINETKFYHIVTIEDPIEFLHQHKNCTVHQRELHSDTPNFALALRAALRQAPKVILVGEMRDKETMEVALEAAETGHLVLSTLHTIDAAKTVERIIGVFPKNEEKIIRTRLAQSFRYIISQRLLPRADGTGRVAAMEILKATSRTKEYIERGETEGKSLMDAMAQGDMEGMQTFDGEIEKLVRAGIVTKADGLAYSSNQGNLLLRLGELSESGAAKPRLEPKVEPKVDSILDMNER